MFDQTLDKVCPHNAFCILQLKKYVDITQIPSLIGDLFLLVQALLAEVAKDQTFVPKAKCWLKINV